MADNNISEIMQASIDSIKSSFDANTVTGEPITTANGTVIIPVSKLTIGFASGGINNNGIKKEQGKSNSLESAAGGTGITILPLAFLVVSPSGKVDLLNINDPMRSDPVFQIVNAIERSPELIAKLKEVFKKDTKEVAEQPNTEN